MPYQNGVHVTVQVQAHILTHQSTCNVPVSYYAKQITVIHTRTKQKGSLSFCEEIRVEIFLFGMIMFSALFGTSTKHR